MSRAPDDDTVNPHFDAFVNQYWKDVDDDAVGPLDQYLAQFSGPAEPIAREFLTLEIERRGQSTFNTLPDFASQEAIDWIGPYKLQSELGRGGFGIVYLAEDSRLGRQVALKVLSNYAKSARGAIKRFRREAAAASRLDHPGICTVYESGVAKGAPYLAMRYVKGMTLRHLIAKARGISDDEFMSAITVSRSSDIESWDDRETTKPTPRPPAPPEDHTSTIDSSDVDIKEMVELVAKCADALHFAHEAGLIHRDVKPGNIMVDKNGCPVILDFGLVMDVTSKSGGDTKIGDRIGTTLYMSPEQLTLNMIKLDRRTDVFSLGVILYELLTLRHPFKASTYQSISDSILNREPENVRKLNPRIPKDLKIIVDTALEKIRDRRYRSCGDFAEDLRRFQDNRTIKARPVDFITKMSKVVRRYPTTTGAAFVIVLIILLVTNLVGSKAAISRENRQLRQDIAAIEKQQADDKSVNSENLPVLPSAQLKTDILSGYQPVVVRARREKTTIQGMKFDRQSQAVWTYTSDGNGHALPLPGMQLQVSAQAPVLAINDHVPVIDMASPCKGFKFHVKDRFVVVHSLGAELRLHHVGRVVEIAMSFCSRYLASREQNGLVRVFDLMPRLHLQETNKNKAALTAMVNLLQSLHWDPQNETRNLELWWADWLRYQSTQVAIHETATPAVFHQRVADQFMRASAEEPANWHQNRAH